MSARAYFMKTVKSCNDVFYSKYNRSQNINKQIVNIAD